nr:flagellar hook-basal body protein [uncultured Bacillus sp.]
MNRTMITATNTLTQLQKKIDVIGNNMANVDTVGYKKRDAKFADLLVQQFNNQPNEEAEIGRLTPNGIRSGTGAKLGQIQMVTSQGTVKATDRTLDTAFTKEGLYYRVQVRNGETNEIQYTRNGAFYLSPISDTETILVTGEGNPVLNEENQPIVMAADSKEYSIDVNGHVVVTLSDGRKQAFDLGVTRIDKPQFLELKGGNLLGLPANADVLNIGIDVLTDLDGALRGEIAIQQGALEQSNVDLSKEMTDLMNAQRSYQFQTRSVSIADQMMGLINGMR